VRPVARAIARKVQRAFVDPQIALHLDYLEGELRKDDWFGGGSFGVADIAMSFPLEAAAARGGLGPDRPKLAGFLDRIHARPAYRRALERGGAYRLAPAPA
jgi:glutathione S-transferase